MSLLQCSMLDGIWPNHPVSLPSCFCARCECEVGLWHFLCQRERAEVPGTTLEGRKDGEHWPDVSARWDSDTAEEPQAPKSREVSLHGLQRWQVNRTEGVTRQP